MTQALLVAGDGGGHGGRAMRGHPSSDGEPPRRPGHGVVDGGRGTATTAYSGAAMTMARRCGYRCVTRGGERSGWLCGHSSLGGNGGSQHGRQWEEALRFSMWRWRQKSGAGGGASVTADIGTWEGQDNSRCEALLQH